MKNLNFGTLVFANEKEYYCALGAFCNKNAFSISYEPNKATGSYADAYRMRKLASANALIKPIQDALRSGNRINCNDYVNHIIKEHNFIQKGKKISGTLENVIKTVPNKYRLCFIEGYTNSAKSDDNRIVVYETDTIKNVAKSLKRTSIPKKSKKTSSSKTYKSKHDYIKENIRNLDIGQRGEKLVFELEREKLIKAVKAGKISSVEKYLKWVSIDDDSVGYDILSFDVDTMTPIYIEVKTTTGSGDSPFYISKNELEFSKKQKSHYKLYRIYNFKKDVANYYELNGDISNCAYVEVSPVNYLVYIK